MARAGTVRRLTAYVALLRAVNVGGTGKLPMSELVRLCSEAGFSSVGTYIQSGNAVFGSDLPQAKVKAKLEKAVGLYLGKPCSVLVRSAAEIDAALAGNPFPKAPPNRVIVSFLDTPPPKGALAGVTMSGGEEVEIVGREVFIHYPNGQGKSKLRLPFAQAGTGRNLNTVAQLADMARAVEQPPARRVSRRRSRG